MIIADTSPIQYLVLTGNIEVLPHLYKQILVPPAVLSELQARSTPRSVYEWAAHLPGWVAVQSAPGTTAVLELDPGETEVIHLALWLREHDEPAEAILVDDRKARQVAETLGIPTIGTLGVLVRGAVRGWVDLPDSLYRLQVHTNFRGTPALYDAALASFHSQMG